MSLFKPPSWAKQSATQDEDDGETNLFSHSNSFMSIQKERIERDKQRAEEAKAKEQQKKVKKETKARKTSLKRDTPSDEESEEKEVKKESKKRRINSADSAKLLAQAGFSTKVIDLGDSDDEDASQPPSTSSLPVRRSPRNKRTKDALSPADSKSKLRNALRLGEQSENDDVQITAVSIPPPPPPEPDEDDDSDPEIAAMKRKAREKARLKEQQKSGTPDVNSSGLDVGEGNSHLPTPPPLDKTIQILITSPLPDTAPIIARRKLSQNLAVVREAWCKKNGFVGERMNTIFLVHKDRRVYNTTRVQRLGLGIADDGKVYFEDDPEQQDVDKVHVEAMTQEMFDAIMAEKAREAKLANQSYEAEVEEPEVEEEEPPVEPVKKQIRIFVRAKGQKPFKVQVTPETVLFKIIKAAKKSFELPPEQDAYIEFDGERLDPEGCIGNTEIEDLDNLDMYLSK